MWKIEIAYRYTNIISHLIFDTKELAEAERNKLTPYLGKDLYDLKRNGSEAMKVTLTDKFGTTDIVHTEVKAVRCYDGAEWDKYAISKNVEYEREMAKAKKID